MIGWRGRLLIDKKALARYRRSKSGYSRAQLEAISFDPPAQRRPVEASPRPPQEGGLSPICPPPWGGQRAPKARGGGGNPLGSYRLIDTVTDCSGSEKR